ncbi:MAG: hypothetical protein ACI33S_04150 [Bacilli bacterium]
MRLKNKSISNYSKYKLSKIDDSFSIHELDRIDELVINNKIIESDNETFSFYELYDFNNLEKLTLRFFDIEEEYIIVLNYFKKLKDIVFDNCNIFSIGKLKDLDSLSLINCKFDFNSMNMKSLKNLTIINSKIDLNSINEFTSLKYLNISYCTLDGNLKLQELEDLHIDNTNILDFSFLKELINLKSLTIDTYQYEKAKYLIDNLNINIDITIKGVM